MDESVLELMCAALRSSVSDGPASAECPASDAAISTFRMISLHASVETSLGWQIVWRVGRLALSPH